MEHKLFVSYTALSFTDRFWNISADAQQKSLSAFCEAMRSTATSVSFYQVYPSRPEYDLIVWSTVESPSTEAPAEFMRRTATAASPFRGLVQARTILCGMTRPSIYAKPRENTQEIDPFSGPRELYFVIYPFTKTTDWYLKSREERQEMMNAHMKTGRSYPQIKQLLLYSFGIQDQEFVVAYEMADLGLFSALVQELRSTQARAFTLNDMPIITGMLRTPDELADIFCRGAFPVDAG